MIRLKRGFEMGNMAAAKYTDNEYIAIFKQMFEFALDPENEVRSLQDVYSVEWQIPKATFCDICNRVPECNDYRAMIKDVIISRVNKLALKGEAAAAPAIWRMKQCGEIDSATVNQNHTGIPISEHHIVFEDYTKKENDRNL